MASKSNACTSLTEKGPGNNTKSNYKSITTYLHDHNYRLGKVIGEGSYSKVRITTRYLSDGSPTHRLACKIINKRRASDDFVTKFLPREIEVLSRIDHPNIIHVYDMVELDDNVYIFMDWCDKGDLLEYVKNRGHVSEAKARFYFRQLLSAIHYLHTLDLAHRDLKCENILMKNHNDKLFLSDFGFARYCSDKGKRVLSSTYCGSAAYASPEILQGIPYNPKLYDLWSLGCILFIMLTGHMPFDESNIPKMLQVQQDRVLFYPAPTDGTEPVTDLAKSCIRRMLEPDVTRRANIEQACNQDWVTAGTPMLRPQTSPDSSKTSTAISTNPLPDSAGDGTYSFPPPPRQHQPSLVSRNNNGLPPGMNTRLSVLAGPPEPSTSRQPQRQQIPNTARIPRSNTKQNTSQYTLSSRSSEPQQGFIRGGEPLASTSGAHYPPTPATPSTIYYGINESAQLLRDGNSSAASVGSQQKQASSSNAPAPGGHPRLQQRRPLHRPYQGGGRPQEQ